MVFHQVKLTGVISQASQHEQRWTWVMLPRNSEHCQLESVLKINLYFQPRRRDRDAEVVDGGGWEKREKSIPFLVTGWSGGAR